MWERSIEALNQYLADETDSGLWYAHVDMDTGETLFTLPVGETPDNIANHPLLSGIDVGNTGSGSKATMVVTKNMLIYSGAIGDGTPHLFAVDKQTGEELARIETAELSRYDAGH